MPLIDLFGIEIRGTDTVSIGLIEFNKSGGSRERAGICVGQIPGPRPGSSLSQQCFKLFARFLDRRAAPSHVNVNTIH